jgi:hypothetical protein
MTARMLNAQIHDIAQGGIALMDGQGWFHEPEQVGMESAWNKIRFNKTFGELIEWDFDQYTPQVVVVAIGQNDNHPFDYMEEDYMCEKAVLWREHYTTLLKNLRQVYPKASIVCCTTLLEHDGSWDKAIDDVVVSLDVFREKFICNLDACKGQCCIEGDAGAPLEEEEVAKLEKVLPVIWDQLSPQAREIIDRQGVCYTDQDGDLVTSIVNGKDCVFTCYDEKGCCYCAIEKAYRDGKVDFYKPVSCHLYPIRVGNYGPYKAVNYHRWDVCKAAVILGQKENVPVYKFLKEPLIRKFGEAWYNEMESVAEELRKSNHI